MRRLVLQTANARLELLPELGGAVGRLVVGGRDLLRPSPENPADPVETACFPLVPFCNRIRDGAFAFDGRQVAVLPTMPGHPHALHGHGWRGAWSVAAVSSDRAVLAFEHAADDWPWAWRAEQRFTLRDDGLRIELELVNTDRRPMPAGLGLHPYFPATAATRLRAATKAVWLTDDEPLPLRLHEAPWPRDWSAGAPVAGLDLVDHCYAGWNGRVEICEPPGAGVTLTASPHCRWLHLYIPPRAGFLCAEPVTHMPDPFARPESGVQILGPGTRLAIWMELSEKHPQRP
jgi:aldose 1-epimerase